MAPQRRIPAYRRHKPSGLAVVRIHGKDFYLGKYDSPESHREYERLIAHWLAGRGQPHVPGQGAHQAAPHAELTINELLLAYWGHAEGYYVKNGRPTGELANMRDAMRPLAALYGQTQVADFGPGGLKTTRQAMIDADLCRTVVNARINRIRRIFRWGVENQLVPNHTLHVLEAVAPLRAGRSAARESGPVLPVPESDVDAVLTHVSSRVALMIRLQLLTAMRPGEVITMRGRHLATHDAVWTYCPASHKTEHYDRQRVIYLGPRAQQLIQPMLKPDLNAYLFSPRDALAELRMRRRAARQTRRTPSELKKTKKAQPKRAPGSRYTTNTYAQAIGRACRRAGVPRWSPNQLRHNAATFLRKEFGIDAARVILGHSSPAVTEVYAELDRAKAIEIMSQVG